MEDASPKGTSWDAPTDRTVWGRSTGSQSRDLPATVRRARRPDLADGMMRRLEEEWIGAGDRMASKLERLKELRAKTLEGGGAERVAAQHQQGKLTARERID